MTIARCPILLMLRSRVKGGRKPEIATLDVAGEKYAQNATEDLGIVNQEHFEKLAGAVNAEALRRAIEALCEPFGSPKDIRLLPNRRDEEYVCFVGLGSPDLNTSIIENFGGFYFANGVAFRIPFKQVNEQGLSNP